MGKDRIGTWQNWVNAQAYLCPLPQSLATSRASHLLCSLPQTWYRIPTQALWDPSQRHLPRSWPSAHTSAPPITDFKGLLCHSFIPSRNKYLLSTYYEQGGAWSSRGDSALNQTGKDVAGAWAHSHSTLGCGVGRELGGLSPLASALLPVPNGTMGDSNTPRSGLGQQPGLLGYSRHSCPLRYRYHGNRAGRPEPLLAGVSSHSAHSGKEAKRGLLVPMDGGKQAQGGGLRCHTKRQVQSSIQNKAPDPRPVTRITFSWDVAPWSEGLEDSTCASCFWNLPCQAEPRLSLLSSPAQLLPGLSKLLLPLPLLGLPANTWTGGLRAGPWR